MNIGWSASQRGDAAGHRLRAGGMRADNLSSTGEFVANKVVFGGIQGLDPMP